ncbi:MAG: hypothetical protein FWD55_07775 [Propionibacteriaceae bacterium]|nr:hypothetical protein [Propionibacteriaceae bacterium]
MSDPLPPSDTNTDEPVRENLYVQPGFADDTPPRRASFSTSTAFFLAIMTLSVLMFVVMGVFVQPGKERTLFINSPVPLFFLFFVVVSALFAFLRFKNRR